MYLIEKNFGTESIEIVPKGIKGTLFFWKTDGLIKLFLKIYKETRNHAYTKSFTRLIMAILIINYNK